MSIFESSRKLSNTVDQVVIAESYFENTRRYNIIGVSCCNMVNKVNCWGVSLVGLLMSFLKLIRTVNLLHMLARVIQIGGIRSA